MNYGAVKEAAVGLQSGVWENVVVNNFSLGWGQNLCSAEGSL